MLAAFCLRLAFGMVVFLPLLPARTMHPRFFRTQFLTALGLAVVAALNGWFDVSPLGQWLLAGGVAVSLAGALVWTLEPAPLGRMLGWVAGVVLAAAASVVNPLADRPADEIALPPGLATADAISSGLLLGAAVTAMLV